MSDAGPDDTVPNDTLAEGEATGDARTATVEAPEIPEVIDVDDNGDTDGETASGGDDASGSQALPGSGSGPRRADETVTADDLTELQDEPTPVEPTD
jgi:hypothetical protein